MRPFLLAIFGLVACVGQPPTPCTQCGDVCVDTKTDVTNCGSCGKACAGGERCVASKCTATCPGSTVVCQGQCVDNQTDPRHCGACNMACAAGQACVTGMCQASCAAPNMMCGAGCVNVQNDPANCGACGNACDAGVCSAGTCRLTCLSPLTECAGGRCADLGGDPNNCGACGNACDAGVCSAGTCRLTCLAPLTECPGGRCADLRGDPSNCGACGTVCSPMNTLGATCNASACAHVGCMPGFSDCDDDLRNGCEVTGSCVRSILLSRAIDGGQSNGSATEVAISGNGSRVAFISAATNLVAGDPSASTNVFLWDRGVSGLVAADLRPDGGWPTQNANTIALSPNGRWLCINHNGPLAEVSGASSSGNAYLRDLEQGVTRLASAFTDGGPFPAGSEVFDCQVSDDGRFVAFTTRVVLDPRHNNGEHNVYLHDMTTGANILASVGTNGQVGADQGYGANAFNPRLNSNATKVAWGSAAGYPTDGNSCFDAWFRDLDAGVTTKVSISGACITSQRGAGPAQIYGPRNTVLTTSTHPDLPGDNNNLQDVYIRDLTPLANPDISSDSQLFALANGNNTAFNVSADGRWLLFGSAANNLCPVRGTAGFILLKDFSNESVQQVNFPESISGGGGTLGGRLSTNGRFIVWVTLDTGSGDTNNLFDVFWRQLR